MSVKKWLTLSKNYKLILICVEDIFKYFSPQVEIIERLTLTISRRMKRIAILLTVIFFSFMAQGQQDPQITQNSFNRLQINPAFAGSKEAICGTLLHRQQWTGFEGAPQTTIFSAHSNFNWEEAYQKNAGVGLAVMLDELGNQSTLNAKLMYAYRHAFNFAPGYFSLGIDAGFISQSWADDWKANDPASVDPAIPGAITSNVFDLGLGLYYYNGDNYFAGFSVEHLTEPSFASTGTGYDFAYPMYRTFYFMAGNNFRPFNTSTPLQLRHSLFVKTQISEWQLDYNINLLINNFFWVGPSYRLDNTVSILGGMDFGAVNPSLEGLKLGLSYDISATSQFSQYNNGGFEVMINYCYKITPPVKIRKYRTVKWL
jgi:type IX secretion system PorP/SprF family membrane protein